jgi:hypothetical protein
LKLKTLWIMLCQVIHQLHHQQTWRRPLKPPTKSMILLFNLLTIKIDKKRIWSTKLKILRLR